MRQKDKSRTSAPKVRTGCKTCKIRHTKCDENKPSCNNCRKARLNCDGFAEPLTDFSYRNIMPKGSLGSFDLGFDLEPADHEFSGNTWGLIFKSESDYRYFNFFESSTAMRFSGFLDTDLWGRVIIQACMREAFARHGTIALSALHKTIKAATTVTSSSGRVDVLLQTAQSHQQVALTHYVKSLSLMRQRLVDVSSDNHLRNLMVSCLLTVSFENHQGSQKSAFAHAVSGIKLLWHFQETHSLNSIIVPTRKGDFDVENSDYDLTHAFTRLEIMVIGVKKFVPEQRHILTQFEYTTKVLSTMPSEIRSLREAQFYWDIMVLSCMHRYYIATAGLSLLSPMTFPRPGPEHSRQVKTTAPVESCERPLHRLLDYLEVCEQWSSACESLFNRLKQSAQHSDFYGASVLRVYILVSRLQNCTSVHQNIKDSEELFQLAKRMLDPSSPPAAIEQYQAFFGFDGSLIQMLFALVIRCGIRRVRRIGIAILNICRKRGGFWGSEMAAKVTQWFVDTEEAGLGPQEDASPDSRLVLVSNKFILDERKSLVQCARSVKGEVVELSPPVLLMW